jgi:hypothetical protein
MILYCEAWLHQPLHTLPSRTRFKVFEFCHFAMVEVALAMSARDLFSYSDRARVNGRVII